MEIALYQGRSLTSRLIRWITRSQYSHAAFVFDAGTEAAAVKLANTGVLKLDWLSRGSVIEAWEPRGVRCVPSISNDHTPGTTVDIFRFEEPLSLLEEEALLLALEPTLGEGYDFKNVFRFITKSPGTEDDEWFCSELVADKLKEIGRPLFNRTAGWEVPPDWVQRPRALIYDRTEVTG